MFRTSNFDKTLEVATSHLLLEPDWPSILLICDSIRQNDVTAKQAFQAIKKKMTSPNPHTAYYSLLVLESIVKNCGSPIHEEISTRENCEMFSAFIESTPHENVKAKMLELIQTWAYAFRSSEKYQAIKDTMTILKAKGHTFPELKEADAMFTADTAPDWADGTVCHRCRVEFTFTQRKHHCRNCGQIFCAQCSSKQCPLPKFGIEKEVRVCDGCYSQLQKPSGKSKGSDTDLPAEYLSSSLAQQSQTPPRKSEQELKEEEELQLALALSQSEAEQKTKTTSIYRAYQKSPSPEAPPAPVVTNSLPIEETPSDPELAKYLNRSYWEQRKTTESPASPSAPSPMPQVNNNVNTKSVPEDVEIDDFANNMKSQVEIFVNRMKSNSSRGRNISNDSSVQTLFMNITSLHSRLLSYIKDMDDKRMWYEQLQDKLTQVKDSRAALDVLRQEHVEKLRRIAEEQERLRQLQMAHKLEIMRKKKQEYLQYQRQLALQRIQEQEREMQMRQEQQKAQYRISQTGFPFIPGQQNSPNHQMPNPYPPYSYNANPANIQRFIPQGQIIPGQQTQPGMPPQQQSQGGLPPQQQPQPGMPPQQQPQPGMPPQQQPQPGMPPQMPQPQHGMPPVPMPGMFNPGMPPVTNQGMIGSQMTAPQLPPGPMHIPPGTVHQPQPLQPPQQQMNPIHSGGHPNPNGPAQLPHSAMVPSSGPIPQQNFIPNQQQIPNMGMPGMPNPMVHGGQTGVPPGAPGRVPSLPTVQAPPNETQSNLSTNIAPPKQEEESNEVRTAELISFD